MTSEELRNEMSQTENLQELPEIKSERTQNG